MSNKPNNVSQGLNLKQLCLLSILLMMWVILVLGLMHYLPNESHITPALWLHGTSILLVLFLIKRFGLSLKTAGSLHTTQWRWFMIACGVGLLYWLLDYWLMSSLFAQDNQSAIHNWKAANNNYHMATVFISSVILAPVLEELFFRGLIFNHLEKRINIWLAAMFSAWFFAAIHWSWPEFISIFTAGLIYAYLLQRSGSLFIPICAHVTHNLITFIYYCC